jgi:uncharacterized lipoprotein YehR (DUF1307 family)
MLKEIYVKLRDAGGSFTDLEQGVTLVGDIPAKVKKTPHIENAIMYRALVMVENEEAEKILKPKGEKVEKPNPSKAESAEFKLTQENYDLAAEKSDYNEMLETVKALGIEMKGKPSKDVLLKMLKEKISE